MRKILASFLAAAMVASLGATMSFAATTTTNSAASITMTAADAAVATLTVTSDGGGNYANGDLFGPFVGTANDATKDLDFSIDVSLTEAQIAFKAGAATIGTVSIPLSQELKKNSKVVLLNGNNSGAASATVTAAADVQETEIADVLNNKKFTNLNVGGKLYSGKIVKSGVAGGVNIQFDDAAKVPGLDSVDLTVTGTQKLNIDKLMLKYGGSGTCDQNDSVATLSDTTFTTTINATGVNVNAGNGTNTADISGKGIDVAEAIVCDGEGNPIPLTEKQAGVDKDQNSSDGVQSGKTVYFAFKDGGKKFDDDNYWKLKINKGDNSKYIKAISDVTKTFDGDLFNLSNRSDTPVPGTGKTRHRYIKVELKDIYTDDEYKISLDLRLTPEDKAVNVFKVADDAELKIKDFTFYVKNIVKSADNDWKVGVNGLMLELLENDWNNITWYDEDGDLAHLKLFSDSDTDKFFSKLSTKWDNADYASYFNDQDAFKFEFTGSPTLSSTSRADLEIYSPFVDEDGNETIDPATAVIYQVIDGELINVSDSFTYAEGDNGDMAYKARTRFLGTYIICEKEVEEASNGEVPDELAPDEIAPDGNVTPDAGKDNGGKAPANTGRNI